MSPSTSGTEFARLHDQLTQKEQLSLTLEALLESIADGVVALDFKGQLTHVSDGLHEPSFGTEPGLPPLVLERLRQEAKEVGTQPRRFELRWSREETGARVYEVVAAAATSRSLHGTDTPTREHLVTLFAFHDRTAMHELSRELERTRDLAALGRMSATVAHELRNPLGVIQGFASLLQRDVEADSDSRSRVEKILQGCDAANRIVEDLLEYSRPVEPRWETISVESLLAEGAASLQVSPRWRNGIVIDMGVERGVPAIRGDRRLLLQALANLLNNAMDAMEDKGSISLRVRSTGGINGRERVRIVIRDSGCGLSAEEVSRVFQPFYTTKPGGTGLGMAIVRRTIEVHGGEIHVVSAQGRGTSVVLDFPAESGAPLRFDPTKERGRALARSADEPRIESHKEAA